jgi:hypothetical protein
MKFVRLKEDGEKLYREAESKVDIAYYSGSPRWEKCSDEEWNKAMNPEPVVDEAGNIGADESDAIPDFIDEEPDNALEAEKVDVEDLETVVDEEILDNPDGN